MAQKQLSNIPHSKDANAVIEKLATCPSIVDDLKDIYSNKFLTDVTLKTKTNLFPAHMIVLCARSPVFKVMFSNDMKEKISDCIQVDDLEDDTVQQLLLFLYSDNLEDLQWETASKLYYAADKYQVEKLKLICSSFLIRNLTASTATELLLLADIHSDSILRKVVDDFILEHDQEVFCSNNWETFMEANPQLALKTLHLKYKAKEKLLSESDDGQSYAAVRQMEVDGRPKRNCFLCGKTFLSFELYEKHLLHVHMEWVEKNKVRHNDGANPNDVIRTSLQREEVPKPGELADISFPSKVAHYCHICDTLFSSYPVHYLHMQDFHRAEKCFRCVITSCQQTFTSHSKFEQHIQEQAHPQDMVRICSVCNTIFASQQELENHRSSTIHYLRYQQWSERSAVSGKMRIDNYRCKICRLEFNMRHWFIQHMETANHDYK